MWLQDTSSRERRALLAGFLGYGVDGFDFMIYTFVIPTLLAIWNMTKSEAGLIATGALLTSSVGGWIAGILADRVGRVRVLQLTVLWFAVFTALSGFTHSYLELLFTRCMQGFGFGGEWAVGSALVAETVAAQHRGKAVGLVQSSWAVGWALAALSYWGVYALCPPEFAWKILFWIGILPALLVIYIRRRVEESPTFVVSRRTSTRPESFLRIFQAPFLGRTMLASLLCAGMLGGYYSVTTWLPTYLKTERQLSVTGTSGYLLVLIVGSFTGYLTSAWVSDALGRRRGFILFAVGAALLILAYTRLPITDAQMLFLGFPLGFFLSGVFSGSGAFLSELYPHAVRGSGLGFCYNVGRAVSAVCPAVIGAASQHRSLGGLICAMAVGSYALVVLAAWALPETRGRPLEADLVAR